MLSIWWTTVWFWRCLCRQTDRKQTNRLTDWSLYPTFPTWWSKMFWDQLLDTDYPLTVISFQLFDLQLVTCVLIVLLDVFDKYFISRYVSTAIGAWAHTHTQSFNGLFSRTTWVGQYQKDKPFWILLRQRWWGGSGISWTICKSFALRSRQITMPAPHHSSFYRPDALPAAQPTASKHWKPLEREHEGSNASFIRNPVVVGASMRPGHWLGAVLYTSLSALTLLVTMVGWHEGHPAHWKPCHLYWKALFQNKWRGNG